VNEARNDLFFYCRSKEKLENIPPSRAALLQHVKRAAYPAGFVWSQTLEPNPTLPNPSMWEYGNSTVNAFGCPYRELCQRNQRAAENSSSAHVKNDAQEDGSVPKQPSVHTAVFVVDNVQA
jgi:hypothetical protein